MKTNLSIDGYVCLLLARALWCFLGVAIACVGFAVIENNETGNNYRMKKVNKDFESVFFAVIAIFEGVSVIIYICLWIKSRNL